MTDFHVDLNALYDAAAAWSDASRELSEAANMAKDVPAGQDAVNWAMFQKSWSAQVEVAQYMQDRFVEGSTEAAAIGDVLRHVATVYHEQDSRFADVLKKLEP